MGRSDRYWEEEEKEENMVEQVKRQSQGVRVFHDVRRRRRGEVDWV